MLAQTTYMAAGLLSLLVSPTLASFHDLDATLHNRMLMNKRQNGKTFNLMSDWRNAVSLSLLELKKQALIC